MQWTVFVLSSAVLVTARTRSGSREEFGVGSVEPSGMYEDTHSQLWNPRYQKDLYDILNSINEKSDSIITADDFSIRIQRNNVNACESTLRGPPVGLATEATAGGSTRIRQLGKTPGDRLHSPAAASIRLTANPETPTPPDTPRNKVTQTFPESALCPHYRGGNRLEIWEYE